MSAITTRLPFSRTGPADEPSTTETLLLPPQTTPFTPPHNAYCELSVYCKDLTHSDGLVPLSSGLACQAVNALGEGKIGFETRCFPDGYFTLFNNMYEEIGQELGTTAAEEPGWSTLAYPGSACLSGWTTACVTAVTDGNSEYSQAWCCPPDSWTCMPSESNGGLSVRSGRYCASAVTLSTEVWMAWDPPYTDPVDHERYSTWIAPMRGLPTGFAATVYHEVFPLQLTMASSMPSGTNTNQGSDSDASSAGGSSNPVTVVFGGVIVGIAIGTALGVLGALCGAIFLYRRRRKRRTVRSSNDEDPTPSPQNDELMPEKPEPEGDPAAQAKDMIQMAELDVGASRSEINGSGPELRRATVSPLSSFGLDPMGSDEISPSSDSRHESIFEMSG
ncbi:hypothetical protein K445DRAFT_15804 [Daldinia sp. EC12]|nr:hypothetical protein K445DRAFT_15804 [Daldinia sp. EC12]